MVRFAFLLTLAFNLPFFAKAEQTIPVDQLDYFETHVRPNLIKYCYECHSEVEDSNRGGLYVDTREGMRQGGSTGSLFDDENWEYSLFVDAITWADEDFEMPPKKKMPDEVIEHLKKWVQMGAPDPRERKSLEAIKTEIDIEAGKKHWSYQSPMRPAEKSVDEIVEKKRTAEGLEAVGEADVFNLLRRLSFDLTGLPPTPPEVKSFYAAVKENRKSAITEKVDQLLASKHFGERWGRHWLDVARYAESSGNINAMYPYAWRYRDYIIDSYNNDKPYDQMVTEQLAGDLLPSKNDHDKQEKMIATGFLAVGSKKQNEKNREVFQMDLIDEQIDTTTRAFMGTTVSCARCHDHKFDPIPTADYYAMAGIFKSTETLWGTIAGNQNHRTTELVALPIPDNKVEVVDERNLYQEKAKELEEAIEANSKARAERRRIQRSGDQEALMQISSKSLVKMKQRVLRLESELKLLNPDGTTSTYSMGARDGDVTQCNILVRGDVTMQAQEVERGFLQVLDFAGTPEIPSESSGRLELAEWITSTNNPLTARVMANRIWLHLMGAPIVETMDNFGFTGLPPTNPELLDYLAISFVESGWSIKETIREIVLSDTYQLAATWHADNYAKDPDNNTYWRSNPGQLDAESLRDSMLLVSGQLNRERPYGSLVAEIGDQKANKIEGFDIANYNHRSIYLPIVRDKMVDELGLFDFPDPLGTVGQRSQTNVAPQSLYLMNSKLIVTQAREMAKVLEKNFSNTTDRITNAFMLCYGRPATSDEVQLSLAFLQTFVPNTATPQPLLPSAGAGKGKGKSKGKGKGKGKGKAGKGRIVEAPPEIELDVISDTEETMASFCQSLMMSAEFRMQY